MLNVAFHTCFSNLFLYTTWIFSRRIQNRWFLVSVGTCRKNRIRRVAPRRRGRVAFRKKRAFPLLPIALEILAREDAISLFAVISRATRTTNADAGIGE